MPQISADSSSAKTALSIRTPRTKLRTPEAAGPREQGVEGVVWPGAPRSLATDLRRTSKSGATAAWQSGGAEVTTITARRIKGHRALHTSVCIVIHAHATPPVRLRPLPSKAAGPRASGEPGAPQPLMSGVPQREQRATNLLKRMKILRYECASPAA